MSGGRVVDHYAEELISTIDQLEKQSGTQLTCYLLRMAILELYSVELEMNIEECSLENCLAA